MEKIDQLAEFLRRDLLDTAADLPGPFLTGFTIAHERTLQFIDQLQNPAPVERVLHRTAADAPGEGDWQLNPTEAGDDE